MGKETKANYVQHFSTRIPWKDNDYTGRIDDNPKLNVACQIIPNIASERNIEFEEENKGKSYEEVGVSNVQNWVTENAAFMNTDGLDFVVTHPFSNHPKYKHLKETKIELKPYSFLLRPFSWMLIGNAKERSEYYNFHFDIEGIEKMKVYNSEWVSHGESQKGIFDYFYSGVIPNESLIFPYYKQVPFIEDGRRVIAGIGNIVSDIEYNKYDTDEAGKEENYIWETNATHSIRDNGKEGFLMPYHEMMEYAEKHPDFDIESVTLFEADGFREEFSYAAEWVSYDAAIDVLNQSKTVLGNIRKLNLEKANSEWVDNQLEYVNSQLKKVWNQRGVYPGLGAMLSAFGLKYGFDIAKHVDTSQHSLFGELTMLFSGEKNLGIDVLDESLIEKRDEFFGLTRNTDRVRFFELLSRINLSTEQAKYAWKVLKEKAEDFVNNPYLLYEVTRKEEEDYRIAISKIDNAMYLNQLVDNNHPIEEPTKMESKSDKRRFRAMMKKVLENAANKGHTLLSYGKIVEDISKLSLDQETNFQIEKIDGIIDFLEEGGLYIDEENQYIKLKEFIDYKLLVGDILKNRFETDLPIQENWEKIVGDKIEKLKENKTEKEKERYDQVGREQAKALRTLESSMISVLMGRAGTGKTTALGIFASSDTIKKGGVLALAPTGKARVQLENSFRKNSVKADFMTVAQFLNNSGGFDGKTMEYCIPTKPSSSEAKTVIVDESSMLTESMFAGILKLVNSHAERIIFVGDPNQLPPIGAGRPFVDLIHYLEDKYSERIGKLETEVRQEADGNDLSFARLFSDMGSPDKDIFLKIQNEETDNRLEFLTYDGEEELEKLFFKQLIDVTKMDNIDDTKKFDISLGAEVGEYTNYRNSKHLEDWQILTPMKARGMSSGYFNNLIHQKYRKHIVDLWKKYPYNKPLPRTIQEIVYGDKVISNENKEKDCWDEINHIECREYVSNGEIGIMAGYPYHYGRNDRNESFYKFRFSSFEDKTFSYLHDEFGSKEGDPKFELAYALTIHKSQGSGFKTTIVVINGKSPLLTKELLYTAFSRQKTKLIVLSDLSIDELVKYSNDWYSDTKQRYTDLFELPNIKEIDNGKQKRYFEEKLIHRTTRGEMVRSKSEVIVANILDKLDIDYTYEEELEVNGITRIPDFTLRYQGRKAYLEHLGMLNKASYVNNWEVKRRDFEKEGISEENGNLITTEDNLDRTIDAQAIEKKIKNWMNQN